MARSVTGVRLARIGQGGVFGVVWVPEHVNEPPGQDPALLLNAGRRPYVRCGSEYPGMRRPYRRTALSPRRGADPGRVDISAAAIRMFGRLGWAATVRWSATAHIDSRHPEGLR